MDNLELYNRFREVPKEALKPIQAGRLKGMSDINPMWRIKKLTEQFGAVGVGWYYEITKQWLEESPTKEIAAFCNILLYVKIDGEWSKPIAGTGGSTLAVSERNGIHTDDECYKKALTDALSVACKAIGIAADVYWDSDRTKYTQSLPQSPPPPQNNQPIICKQCGKPITSAKKGDKIVQPIDIANQTGGLCLSCYKACKA